MNQAGPTSTSTMSRPPFDARPTPPADLVDRLWSLFASLRLALGLILAIAALGLISVLVPQAPPGFAPDTAGYAAWVERVARPRYGAATDALAILQLFAATGSVWMRLLLGLLAVNTLVCTLNRLPRLWAGAGRGRIASLGTIATHLAVILFLFGGYATSAWGVRVPGFAVAEGSARAVGLGSGLVLLLDDFAAVYHPDGTPKDYRSDVALFDGETEVARRTVRVNAPLEYAGLRFHQEAFGRAAILRVQRGDSALEDGVALSEIIGGRPAGILALGRDGPQIVVLGAAPDDPALPPGSVRIEVLNGDEQLGGEVLAVGQSAPIAGLTVTYLRESQYSSFQVVSDPGAPIIWIAGFLFVGGVAVAFGFPRRESRDEDKPPERC